MDKIIITVFTPTYNRDKYITNLFTSLCNQTVKTFEWIIVDQGQDSTEELAQKFKKNADFPIIYKKLKGERGISRAFNKMLEIANGNLVMKVDDDDRLTSDAIESIIKMEQTILIKDKYAGVSGLRQYPDGKIIGENWKSDSDWIDCTNLERGKHGLNGDKAEAYYLRVLQEYGPMPTVPGEYFTWEGILWDRIAHAGKLVRWFNHKIYYTEYLPGGATNTRVEARKNNFFTYSIFVSERMGYTEIPFLSRIKLSCRYFELLREKKLPFKKIKNYFYGNMVIAFIGYICSIFTKYIPQNLSEL